ncbi:MAG: phytanoyl-CoA dioxygenase family protein [Chloroflexota bacterium]
METKTSSDIVKQYEREGYVIIRDVIDPDLIQEARDHVDWLVEKNPGIRPENLHHGMVTKDAFWVRLVSDDRLLDVVEQFIGPDLGLFASHYIAKPPHTGKPVPWHQDGSYWPLEPMEVITAWLSFDRSDDENGCMRVLPKTQHKKLLSLDEYVEQSEENLFSIAMDPTAIDDAEAVSLILNPGDISIHHPNIVHGSNPNASSRWRRGLTIRYIPTSTRITREQPHPAAFIFRGQGYANGNGWNPLPPYTAETSMAFSDQVAWDEKCERHNSAYGQFLIKAI